MLRTFGSFVSILAAAALAAPASAAPSKGVVVRVTAETEIAAPPAAVWTEITAGQSLVTWCPMWKSDANRKIQLDSVGDVLDFTDEYGNGGRSVVTFLSPGAELRVAHEPNDASYMCQARLLLSPTATGTRVTYHEQYTDDSSAEDAAATAAKTETRMAATLAALKAGAEGAK